MEKVLEIMKKLNVKRVLDIASGQGEFIHFVRETIGSFEEIIGIDASEGILDRARQRFKDEKISFKVMDAFSLDFAENSFDLVTISNSLHHFNEPEKILKEAFRVLKPEGKLIVSEMVSDNLEPDQESHKLIHHWSAKLDRLNGGVHNETYSEKDLIDLVRENSENDIEIVRYRHEIPNPKDPKMVEQFKEITQMMLKRIKNKDELPTWEKEASDIIAWIEKHGYSPASFVFMIN